MGFNRQALTEFDAKQEAERRRLEKTRPPSARLRFPKGEPGDALFEQWLGQLPRGDRVVAGPLVYHPPGLKSRRMTRRTDRIQVTIGSVRRPYYVTRVVDRKIWAKLDNEARGRYIERVREELLG